MKKYEKFLIIVVVIIPIVGTVWMYYFPSALPFIKWTVMHGGNYATILSGYFCVIALGVSIAGIINSTRS